jgi:cytidylate kinase
MASLEKIIERQMLRWEAEKRREEERAAEAEAPDAAERPRVITVSRQLGSGGELFAAALADRLDLEIFDRQIVEHIATTARVREQLVEYLSGGKRSEVTLLVDAALRHEWLTAREFVATLAQVVGSVAMLGEVVIMGRGANFLLGLDRGVHIRVVAPVDARVARLANREGVDEDEARRLIEANDQSRREYIQHHFGEDIDNPSAYHLMINTVAVDFEAGVQSVLRVAQATFKDPSEAMPER